ncbi:Protein sprouty [Anthophora plagiata]
MREKENVGEGLLLVAFPRRAAVLLFERTAIIATTSPLTSTAATTTTTSTTPLTTTLVPAPSASQGSTTSSSARVSPQPPPLTPPQYPAPPRPPSRNGGDEARVARARGSGRGALPSHILANGTPLSRVPPPRAGWAVRINEATLTTPSQSAHPEQQQQQQQQPYHQHLFHHQHHPSSPGTPRTVEQWASERAASSALSVRRSTSPSSPEAARRSGTTGSSRRLLFRPAAGEGRTGSGGRVGGEEGGAEVTDTGAHFASHWQEEEELEAKKEEEEHWKQQRRVDLELRGRPMSQNNAIPPLTRPPSSPQTNSNNTLDAATDASATTTNNADDGDHHHQQNVAARVHDHNRPFPPPRLPIVQVAAASTATATTTTTTTTPPPTPPPSAISTGSPNPRVLVSTAPLSPLSSTFRSRPRNVDTSNETNARGLLSNDTPPRSPIGEVSLTVPRPDGERAINEYVETPFKQHCNQEQRNRFDDENKRGIDCPKIDRRHRHNKGVTGSTVAATHRLHASRTQAFRGLNTSSGANATPSAGSIAANTTQPNAVTKQPVSFTKEPANSLASRTYDPAGLSIMCNFCGRCRCESCREPPPLPSKWLCDNKCFCSADTILDYASCLCCVKGLFYHCVDGSNGGGIDGEAAGSCADEPCSCTGNRKASRWACLGALTLVMPCLLCYWPFKGCVALCETCYARHAAQGCRCNPNTMGNSANRHHPMSGNDIGDSRDPEKRLLDPVTPEL